LRGQHFGYRFPDDRLFEICNGSVMFTLTDRTMIFDSPVIPRWEELCQPWFDGDDVISMGYIDPALDAWRKDRWNGPQ
jgi:hypothetical protein